MISTFQIIQFSDAAKNTNGCPKSARLVLDHCFSIQPIPETYSSLDNEDFLELCHALSLAEASAIPSSNWNTVEFSKAFVEAFPEYAGVRIGTPLTVTTQGTDLASQIWTIDHDEDDTEVPAVAFIPTADINAASGNGVSITVPADGSTPPMFSEDKIEHLFCEHARYELVNK